MAQGKTKIGKGRAKQLMTGNRGRPVPGEIVPGTIADYDPGMQTYTVNINGEPHYNVIPANSIASSLIGFKMTSIMAPGTQVAVLYGPTCWILGASNYDAPDVDSFQSRVMTGTGLQAAVGLGVDADEAPRQTVSGELYQGEFEISNCIGTFIRFLTFMASLGSGERAKIECHLLRDLVRVVSRNFEHFSSSGDFKIMDDGRLSMELNGTTYEHERWGQLEANSPKFETTDTGMPEDGDPQDTGRWRYTMLVGFIGDLFNTWFTDPVGTVGRMAEDALRSGKARMHVGQDGTVLVQSCADIVLERVVRIPVPIRIKHEEDPEGVLRADMNKLDKQFLKQWSWKAEKEHHRLFQLREYVRYLNQYQTLARLHQLSKDWKIPSEEETPAPELGAGEKDRESANAGRTYWKDCYATIRIFRDGSILHLDAYGNAMASGPYGIQHSTTRHFHVYAAGDIVLKAGGSIFASARRHLEFVASRGALLLKARTGLRALCERGTLWLKSDFDPDNEYTPEDGDPKPEVVGEQGIRIQATKGESRMLSHRKMRLKINREDAALELDIRGYLRAAISKDAEIKVNGRMLLRVINKIHMLALGVIARMREGLHIDRACHIKPNGSKFNRLEIAGLESHGPIGGPRMGLKLEDGDAKLRPHTNHIQIFEPEADLDLLSPEEIDDPEILDPDLANARWKLLETDEYKWDNPGLAVDKETFDFEPIAQQHLRTSGATGIDNYEEWDKMTDKILKEDETATDTPWPGASFRWRVHDSDQDDLSIPTATNGAGFAPDIESPLTSARPVFRFLKK